MSMTAPEFMQKLGMIRTGVKAGETSPEVDLRLAQLTQSLKLVYTPEALKAALSENSIVDSSLEESLTTLFMTWTSVRGRT